MSANRQRKSPHRDGRSNFHDGSVDGSRPTPTEVAKMAADVEEIILHSHPHKDPALIQSIVETIVYTLEGHAGTHPHSSDPNVHIGPSSFDPGQAEGIDFCYSALLKL